MESIVNSLRSEANPRLRLGIAPADGEVPGADWVAFVLAPFAEPEREAVVELIQRAADACECWWRDGAEQTMNLFNS